MKANEVSQDDAQIFEGKTKSIQYAIDENGNYVEVKSVGLEAENIVIERAWEDVRESIQDALGEVKDGTKSPIFYFMKKEIMDLNILSETVGIAKWRIKRHFKPNIFAKLKIKTLEKYTKAFNLKNIESLKNISFNE